MAEKPSDDAEPYEPLPETPDGTGHEERGWPPGQGEDKGPRGIEKK